jgi:HTH-type transcriptional regulator/antitoxin HigA
MDYQPDFAVPPGETLLEVLEDRGMTQAELAQRTNRPAKTVNEIIKGKAALTAETALQLEEVLGIPAAFWLTRETRFREVLARIERQSGLADEVGFVKQFPYSELAKIGFVDPTRDPERRVAELRSFFGVTSLSRLEHIYGGAFRVSTAWEPSPGALMAWLRLGEVMAQGIEVPEYNKTRLLDCIPGLRALTLIDPTDASPRLRKELAACGVRLVYVPHLPKTYAHGVTRWQTGNPLVQLSVRGRYEDILWFSLLHEIGHVLLGHTRRVPLIAWDRKPDSDKSELEDEADQFASNAFIPPEEYKRFAQRGPFPAALVRRFASRVGVCPGIVIGRLQHDRLLPHTHLNGLRRRLMIRVGSTPSI